MAEIFVAPDWRCGIQPVLYGNEVCKPNHSFGPTVRNYYLLHFVTNGSGILHKTGVTYQVQSGDIFVIRPNEISIYSTGTKNTWSYIWLGFTSSSVLPFLDKPIIRHPAMRALFSKLITTEDAPLPIETVFALTHEILNLLSANTHISSIGFDYAEAAKQMIDSSYTQNIAIQQISQALHIDRRYLSKLFRQSFGVQLGIHAILPGYFMPNIIDTDQYAHNIRLDINNVRFHSCQQVNHSVPANTSVYELILTGKFIT